MDFDTGWMMMGFVQIHKQDDLERIMGKRIAGKIIRNKQNIDKRID